MPGFLFFIFGLSLVLMKGQAKDKEKKASKLGKKKFRRSQNVRQNLKMIPGKIIHFQTNPKKEVKTTRCWRSDAVLDIVCPFCFAHYIGAEVLDKKLHKKDPGENLGVNRLIKRMKIFQIKSLHLMRDK